MHLFDTRKVDEGAWLETFRFTSIIAISGIEKSAICLLPCTDRMDATVEKDNKFTKILAAAGTVLVWLPLAAPIIFAVIRLIGNRRFMLDYLMPFELFPLILFGSVLLIWAAIRGKARVKLICWSFGAAAALLVLGLVLAQVSGLASGRIEPDGTWNTIVLGFLAASAAALLTLAAGGILLLRDLTKKTIDS